MCGLERRDRQDLLKLIDTGLVQILQADAGSSPGLEFVQRLASASTWYIRPVSSMKRAGSCSGPRLSLDKACSASCLATIAFASLIWQSLDRTRC